MMRNIVVVGALSILLSVSAVEATFFFEDGFSSECGICLDPLEITSSRKEVVVVLPHCRVEHSKGMFLGPTQNNEMSIKNTIITLPCSIFHIFHVQCIRDWCAASADATCPLCRAPIPFEYRDGLSWYTRFIKQLRGLFCCSGRVARSSSL